MLLKANKHTSLILQLHSFTQNMLCDIKAITHAT